MADLTAILLLLGAFLAVVTLVGHGIWVLLSTLFGRRGHPSSRRALPGEIQPVNRLCPRCFAPLEIGQQTCALCGWPAPNVARSDRHAALIALRRQLEELASRGAVDAGTCRRITAVLDEEEQHLVDQQRRAPVPTGSSIAVVEPIAGPMPQPPPGSSAPSAPTAEPATPKSLTLIERARQYAASREAAASDLVTDADEAAEPPRRREALTRLLAAFMEEKNIRWGELVGGLLIVGCSIALVISFWSEIATRPLLKFVLFNGVTAALFGVGVYTDRRWKIHTTSHGLLVIASLLVPLNFLAIAAFTQASPPTDLVSLAGEAVSLIVFALLVYLAGRILVPDEAALLVVGILAPCLMQLLVRRFAGPATSLGWLYALASVPIICYLGTTSVVVWRRWKISASESAAKSFDETEANRVLVFLGLASAASLMPIALLVYNVPPPKTTLHWLSPLLLLCGVPSLLTGILFWRRMGERQFSGLQTAGVAVGVLGAVVMAAAVSSAWPDPATLIPTAAAAAVMMTLVGAWFRIPAAHVPAGLAIAAGWLVGFHLVRGEIGWTLADSALMKSTLLSATSGHALMPLLGLFGGVAWCLRRVGRSEESVMYALVAAATAGVSILSIVAFGFARPGDPLGITWSLAIYAMAAIVAGTAFDRAAMARIGSALLLAALVQGVVFRYGVAWPLEQPWIVALLAHATVATGCAVAIRARRFGAHTNAAEALVWAAEVTSASAAV